VTAPRRRLEAAFAAFDAANAEDPSREIVDGVPQPRELVYARRMSRWLERLEPGASEALVLAARCQHLRRFTIPRDRYPMDGAGYKRWRATLARFHADAAAEILGRLGYADAEIARVQALVRKEKLRTDPEAQTLEDVACLVFLESTLDDFARKHAPAKVIDILRKTWGKMSERARTAALELPLPREARALVDEALAARPT
jgi:hypothetical protein